MKEIADADYSVHKLIIGTNTANNDQNYLMVGKVKLPVEDSTKLDLTEY
jgi:histone-binding protein RBBP4